MIRDRDTTCESRHSGECRKWNALGIDLSSCVLREAACLVIRPL